MMTLSRHSEFYQHREGLLDDQLFESLQHPVRIFLGSVDGRRRYEHEGRKTLARDYCDFVDRILNDGNDHTFWAVAERVQAEKDSHTGGDV